MGKPHIHTGNTEIHIRHPSVIGTCTYTHKIEIAHVQKLKPKKLVTLEKDPKA